VTGIPATDLAELEQALGVRVVDRGLLELAVTHRSHAFEAGGLPTNERLEFLGDAVLGLVVAVLLYELFPESPEGRLAKIRAAAVNTTSLAVIARSLGVGRHVRLGRGEEQSGGRDKDSILADTLEALLAAVYLDRGMAEAANLVTRLFRDLLVDIATRTESLDAKTSLQELTAALRAGVPRYEVSEEGPDHQKRFAATVRVDGSALGRGQGRSKKEAEQGAAAEAITALRGRGAVTSGDDTSPR
jgi:ribonuclease-3